MWKSMKNCAQKWCWSLCAFLFEATCAFGKMCWVIQNPFFHFIVWTFFKFASKFSLFLGMIRLPQTAFSFACWWFTYSMSPFIFWINSFSAHSFLWLCYWFIPFVPCFFMSSLGNIVCYLESLPIQFHHLESLENSVNGSFSTVIDPWSFFWHQVHIPSCFYIVVSIQ